MRSFVRSSDYRGRCRSDLKEERRNKCMALAEDTQRLWKLVSWCKCGLGAFVSDSPRQLFRQRYCPRSLKRKSGVRSRVQVAFHCMEIQIP